MTEEPKLEVKRDIESPPGGWRYTVPQTGVTIIGEFFRDLYQKVRAHMAANSLPMDDWFKDEVMDGACRETNPGTRWCLRKDPKPVAGMLPHLNLIMAETFIRSVIGAIKARKLVSHEEAKRRYDICMNCPLATSIGGCLGCRGTLKLVQNIMLKNRLPDDPAKRWCGACGCHLSVKPWLPNEVLDQAEKVRPQYHPSCWRREENR